jgi:alpha-L-fucosidase 2
MTTRRHFLLSLPAACAAAQTAPAAPAADLRLWYDAPARNWNEALPLGNGRLGAMVYGGVETDRINLNHATLWSGPRPGEPDNPDAKAHLAEVRRLIFARKYAEATDLCKKMQGPFTEAFQPLGDLRFEFPATSGPDNYRRELDLDTAIAKVTFAADGVTYTREMFVSAPAGVLVVRLTADESINLSLTLDSQLHFETAADPQTNRVYLEGKAPAHSEPNYRHVEPAIVYDDAPGRGMYFAAVLEAIVKGGKTSTAAGKLNIERADEVLLLVAAATGYRGFRALPDLPSEAVLKQCTAQLDAVRGQSYQALRAAHLADYQPLFRRVTLDLGPAVSPNLPTDQRLRAFAATPDPQLVALWFQYGRYLLIACSRPGSEPANLQGIWNDMLRPGWSSNHTTNINTEMNYWLAEVCNLPECHEPLMQFIADLSQTGAATARAYYGARGWTAHHNSDLWRRTNPVGEGEGGPMWANWPMGGAWLCQHLWEHYAFSRDRKFLQSAWPVLKGAAEFQLDWLVPDGHGHLTTAPSVSPENSFKFEGRSACVSAGTAMDMALIRDLFTHSIEAARILNVDAALRKQLETALAKLPPPKIGRFGQFQEWSDDFEEADQWHRHQSPFFGLFPGAQFTPGRTPALAKAIATGLDRRTVGAPHGEPGWSYAWLIALRARLRQPDQAYEMVRGRLSKDCVPNLFCGTKQIDGTLGGVAGIAEMLLQSHAGEIHFLPALPAAWPKGRVTGLRARGGLLVDLAWENNRAVEATLHATVAGTHRLRPPEGQKLAGPNPLTLRQGQTIKLTFA